MADTWQTVEQAAVALRMSVRTVNRHISAGKIASRLSEGRREVLVSLPEPETEPDVLKAAVRDAFARLNAAAESELTDALPTEDPGFEPLVNADPDVTDVTDEASVMADEPSAMMDPEPTTVHIPPSDTGSRLGFDAHTVLALADNASDKAEMAVSAYQALARVAEARVEATRRSARFAWAAVALMAAGVTGAVGWTTHHLTQSRADVQHLQQQLSATSATVSDIGQERSSLRTELSAAREAAARAEGRLEAATQASARLETQVKEAREQGKRPAETAESPATQPAVGLFERLARLWD